MGRFVCAGCVKGRATYVVCMTGEWYPQGIGRKAHCPSGVSHLLFPGGTYRGSPSSTCERVDQHWPFQHCLPGSLCHGTRPYNAAFRESLQKQNEWTLLIICQILAIILKAFEIVVKCCVSPLKRMESTQGQGATLLPSCRVRSSATPKSHLRTRSRLTW